MVVYKQKCGVCRKNWALVRSGRQRFVVCESCELKALDKPVKDKALKKLFDVPKDWYKENPFLRSVRYQYSKFGGLTDKQLEALKKTVKEMKQEKAKKKKA